MVKSANLNCADIGVEHITCIVYDELNTPIARGGPWPCEEGSGRIQKIFAGPDRRFTILAWSGHEGNIIYQGQSLSGFDVVAGEIAEVGTIDALPFVPTLSFPAEGETVSATACSLSWNRLANADRYNVMVSEHSNFSSLLVDETTNELSFTPTNLSESATYHWRIRAIDSQGNESAASTARSFTTGVATVCRPPRFDPVNGQQTPENQQLNFTLNAVDPNGGALTYEMTDLPNGAAFDPETRTFSWTPGFGDQGNYTVNATVCDDCLEGPLCDSLEINIDVGDVCRRPNLADPDNRQVDEGEALSVTLSAVDPDESVLTFSHGDLPRGSAFDQATQTFSWTPGFGAAGNYSVTFRVCDDCPEGPLCDSEEMNIDVGNVCRRPELEDPGDPQVDEGEPLNLILNASDPDGSALTFSHSDLPRGASFDQNRRTLRWTPGFGDAGNYPVTFRVCDDCPDGPLCDSEEINITVGNVCRPPVMVGIGNQQIDEGQPLSFTVDASDPDGSALTYGAGNLPPRATFDPQTRTFDWTPDFGDGGNYDVTVTVCDDCPDGPLCVSEDINIAVGNVCRPPELAGIGNQQVDEGSTLRFTLDASDPDGGDLTFSHSELPVEATFDEETRTFSWTPDFGDQGRYTVNFSVCDNCPDGPLCDSEETVITVGNICRPPNLADPGDQEIDEGQPLSFTLSASDPDGGSLTFSHSTLPQGATFDQTQHTFSWTPGFGSQGSYAVSFTVCDDCPDDPLCDTEQINITVGDVCRQPDLTSPGNQRISEGETISFNLDASDPDGGSLRYSAQNLPGGANLDPDTGAFTWATDLEDAGSYTATFTVCDDCPTGPVCDSEQVTITVDETIGTPTWITPGDDPEPEMDNNCDNNADIIEWPFEWSAISNAAQYEIQVFRPDTTGPVITETVSSSSYTYTSNDEISNSDRRGWSCRVRAGNDDNVWSEWSEQRSFNVEPLNTDCPIDCSTVTRHGQNTAETHSVELGQTSGQFIFQYQTFTVADRIVVTYENEVLFDTTCIGFSQRVPLTFSGDSTQVTVEVTPNCDNTENTAWQFTVHCPLQDSETAGQ